MQSYKQEIARKRRIARIFWVIVFGFATFLYFFFQGYYPNIRLGLQEITGTGRIASGESVIKSFGIVNVKVSPRDVGISLNTENYGNDEKKMVDYGAYSLTAKKDGYIPSFIRFQINQEKPFFIEELSLLKTPEYRSLSGSLSLLTKIDDTTWIATESGSIIELTGSLLTKIPVGSGSYRHIGEGYFLSGTYLTRYDSISHTFVRAPNDAWNRGIRSCREPIITQDTLWCPTEQRATMEDGRVLTGVLRLHEDYFITREGDDAIAKLVPRSDDTPIALSGITYTTDTPFFQNEGIWYTISGTTIIPLDPSRDDTSELDLESISRVATTERYELFFGKIGRDTRLEIREKNRTQSGRVIPFPDISLDHMKVREEQGNLWIKTQGALLFIYRENNTVEWIVDGEILAWSDRAALYRTKGALWRASWEEVKK